MTAKELKLRLWKIALHVLGIIFITCAILSKNDPFVTHAAAYFGGSLFITGSIVELVADVLAR